MLQVLVCAASLQTVLVSAQVETCCRSHRSAHRSFAGYILIPIQGFLFSARGNLTAAQIAAVTLPAPLTLAAPVKRRALMSLPQAWRGAKVLKRRGIIRLVLHDVAPDPQQLHNALPCHSVCCAKSHASFLLLQAELAGIPSPAAKLHRLAGITRTFCVEILQQFLVIPYAVRALRTYHSLPRLRLTDRRPSDNVSLVQSVRWADRHQEYQN